MAVNVIPPPCWMLPGRVLNTVGERLMESVGVTETCWIVRFVLAGVTVESLASAAVI
jgi:hypothetical protein